MNIQEAAKEYADGQYEPTDRGILYRETQDDFTAGAEWQKQKAIEVYRNLCPSYKVMPRYECGNYSHRQEWKNKVCDMNCQYMKNLMERL